MFPNLPRALVLGNRQYDPTKLATPPADALTRALAQPTQPQQQQQRQVVQQMPQSGTLARALLQSAYSGENIETPIELAGQLAKAFAGDYGERRKLQDEERRAQEEAAKEEQRLRQIAEAVAAGGYSPEAMIATGDPDMMRMGLEAKLRPENNKPPTPYSDLAQVEADVKNGFLTPEQGQAEARRLTATNGPDPIATDKPIWDGTKWIMPPQQPVGAGVNPQLTEIQDPNGPPGKTIKGWSYPDGNFVPIGDAPSDATKRQTLKDQNGVERYVDTGEPVFPEVETAPTPQNPNQAFDNVSGLRKEIQALPSYKNMAQALPIYQSMVATAGNNSRASDLNLVYGLGKIMDPTSVVREGEMIMAKDTASLPDWFVGAMNRLNGGQALQPATRDAILKEAAVRANAYQQAFNEDMKMYRGIVQRNNINEADVIPNFSDFPQWPPTSGPFSQPLPPATPGPQPRGTVVIDGVTIERVE